MKGHCRYYCSNHCGYLAAEPVALFALPSHSIPVGWVPATMTGKDRTTASAIPGLLTGFEALMASPHALLEDSCDTIADLFNLTQTQLVDQLNPGLNCMPADGLQPGLQICVEAGPAVVLPICNKLYTVLKDDTCDSIRTANNIVPKEFYYLNPGLSCINLQVDYGQQICIGTGSTGVLKCIKKYTVKITDTCPGLLRQQYRSNSKMMSNLNSGFICINARLYVGLQLCVPWWPA
eukprot:TRINITY_DN5109_c0_g1_i2.p1 TRINITY_DN5109_c0_g1~~TRINITY_DN5109_c0_g1_i2.p1  ORF type:complete len:235 (-),score=10.91 TRINITY_DN5109_c0_g1_i2:198-902(-)